MQITISVLVTCQADECMRNEGGATGALGVISKNYILPAGTTDGCMKGRTLIFTRRERKREKE